MKKTSIWVRAAVAAAATSAMGLAQAGWVASSVQATTGQTFLQVVNDQGQAAGYARETGTAQGRFGIRTTLTDRGVFLDGQGTLSNVGLTGATNQTISVIDINRSGQVVFWGSFGTQVYSPGAQTPLRALAFAPLALNDAGLAGGTSFIGPFSDNAWRMGTSRPDGSFQSLGVLGGNASQATAMNNAGHVVGRSQYPGGGTNFRAVLHDGQGLIDLGQLLSPTAYSNAASINDAGTVIGTVNTAAGSRGFVYRNGAMSLLESPDSLYTSADAVNTASQVLGTSCTASSLCEVLLETRGQISLLGRLAGASTTGVALNDRGQALVRASINGDVDFGLWDQGTMMNLDDLVAGLGFTDVAHASLANGFLVGFGTLASGQTQSFLLRDTRTAAVPEPASLLLALAALGLAGAGVRRGTR